MVGDNQTSGPSCMPFINRNETALTHSTAPFALDKSLICLQHTFLATHQPWLLTMHTINSDASHFGCCLAGQQRNACDPPGWLPSQSCEIVLSVSWSRKKRGLLCVRWPGLKVLKLHKELSRISMMSVHKCAGVLSSREMGSTTLSLLKSCMRSCAGRCTGRSLHP